MQFEEISWYSPHVNREMRIKIYGHYGTPIICFPCQDKDSSDFANNGMIDALHDYIEGGRIKLFCVDSNDSDTVSSTSWDRENASYLLDQYHYYIVEEVLPFVKYKQGGDCEPFLMGCSMGATHAAINIFRRPDLFAGAICLSGNYDLGAFFGDCFTANAYNNSPVHFLANMPSGHPWIEKYNSRKIVICIGSGAFEYLVGYSNYWLKEVTDSKGINIWYNFWDELSIHDWPSWHYEARYFIDKLL